MSKSEAWKAYEKGKEKGIEIIDRFSDEGLTYTEAGRALRFAQEELNIRCNKETENKVVARGTENTGTKIAEIESGLYEKAQKFAEGLINNPDRAPQEVAILPQLLEVLLQYGGAGEAKGGKG